MAARKKKEIYLTPEPDWKFLKQAKTEEEKVNAFKQADFFAHYEIDNKTKSSSMKKWIKAHEEISDENKKTLALLPDWQFTSLGKYTWIMGKIGFLPESFEKHILNYVPTWLEAKSTTLASDPDEETTPATKESKPTVSIQDRMKEQVISLCGDWEGKLDDLLSGNVELKKFDPYNEMRAFDGGIIKPNHAKIIKDTFADNYNEAKEIMEWADDDIKEAYSHLDTKTRKLYLEFFEKINTACDTFINTGKATRKTRKPKAISKERLVQKLKFKLNDGEFGIASINPIEIPDCRELWVFNTKNRKLGIYVADEIGPGLSVKGTSIVGFLENKSIQKTLRKPVEQLKDFKGNAKTKYTKAFAEIKATETKLNGRTNEHIILLKAF